MRFLVLIFSFAFLVMLSGCVLRPSVPPPSIPPAIQPTSTPSVPSSTESPDIQRFTSSTRITPTNDGGYPLLIRALSKRRTFQPRGACEVMRETIEIEPTSALDEEKRKHINNILQKAFLTIDRGASDERTVSFDAFVDHTMQECADVQQELNQDESPSYGELPRDYSYETVIDVPKNDHGLISLRISDYEYTGGAHPNSWTRLVTLDVEQEKILTLGDIIRRDQLKAFMQRERRELLKTFGDRLPEEQIEAFRRFVAESPRTANAAELDEFSKFDRFFLTDTDIATEYSPYELASYAAGFLATEFPLDQFRSMIRPELIDRLFPPTPSSPLQRGS